MQRLLSGAQQGRATMQTPSSPEMGMQGANPMQMMQNFAQFKRLMHGRNPQQMVQSLLQSGQMTQEQFDQLKQQASALQNILR